jgi:cysteine desulfurase
MLKLMRIYLDHAATSPLLPEARAAMEPWLDAGNASTLYAEGRAARQAIDEARESVAERLGCEFASFLFTSGGTESAVMAIAGCALANKGGDRRRVLVSAAEHHCTLNTRPLLEALGVEVEVLPVDRYARPQIELLSHRMSDDVLLLCSMHANNELGTLSEPRALADLAHRHGALFFCDAVQTLGKVPWTVEDLGADLVSVSAHKIGGPKGIGGIYVRPGTRLKPLIAGGGQERELRAGTENVAAIAGFGAAVRTRRDSAHLTGLRDSLSRSLIALGARPTLAPDIPCLSTHCHVRFPGTSAETLLIVLDRLGVAAGSGAACSSGSVEPSHVLLACGYSLAEAKEGIRFTLGPATTAAELEEASQRVARAVAQVRGR